MSTNKYPHQYGNGYYVFDRIANAKALAEFEKREAERKRRERTAERDRAEFEALKQRMKGRYER